MDIVLQVGQGTLPVYAFMHTWGFQGGQQKETHLLPHCNQSPEKETVEETVENTLSVFLREGNITADRQKARNFLRPP